MRTSCTATSGRPCTSSPRASGTSTSSPAQAGSSPFVATASATSNSEAAVAHPTTVMIADPARDSRPRSCRVNRSSRRPDRVTSSSTRSVASHQRSSARTSMSRVTWSARTRRASATVAEHVLVRNQSSRPAAPAPSTRAADGPASPGQASGEEAHHEHAGASDGRQREPDAKASVDLCLGILDELVEQLPAAAPESAGCQGNEGREQLLACRRQSSKGDVVRHQPLGVPKTRPGQAERPDPDDRHHQREHGRVLRRLHDQPTGGRRQRHTRQRGQDSEGDRSCRACSTARRPARQRRR